MMGKIFSPGKLLLTSEYFVLDGSLALAVPTRLGQDFFYEEIEDGNSLVYWEALHQNNPWLQVKINYKNWEILETNLPEAAKFILKVLKNAQSLSSVKFNSDKTYHLKTNLQFPSDFGLGSSSTLMNNLAEWAEINPYELNEISLGGSGYDIAIAAEKSSLLYRTKPERFVQKVDFNPSFKDKIIFIHLNQKQDSREGINLYKSKPKSEALIKEFSEITEQVLIAENISQFSDLMEEHEQKISNFLGIPTAKEKYFKDYSGFIKSLGAWGGDFVMASKSGNFLRYFQSKNYNKIFEWSELIDS